MVTKLLSGAMPPKSPARRVLSLGSSRDTAMKELICLKRNCCDLMALLNPQFLAHWFPFTLIQDYAGAVPFLYLVISISQYPSSSCLVFVLLHICHHSFLAPCLLSSFSHPMWLGWTHAHSLGKLSEFFADQWGHLTLGLFVLVITILLFQNLFS